MKTKRKAAQPGGYSFDPRVHGLTQSAMKSFLTCREQFRLSYVLGWIGASSTASLAVEYGSAVHWVLQQIYGSQHPAPEADRVETWINWWWDKWCKDRVPLSESDRSLGAEIVMLMRAVLPAYFARVQKKTQLYNDFEARKWIAIEKQFKVPLKITKGEDPVPIRGQFDGVYQLIGKSGGVWVMDTKNLSVVQEESMEALHCDLQVMVYVWAASKLWPNVKGCIYNIIRRPTLRRKVDESDAAFSQRIKDDVAERPDFYFSRYEVTILPEDIRAFESNMLLPLVRDILRWYDSFDDGFNRPGSNPYHYMNPLGLVTKYGASTYYAAISRGDFSGLIKRRVPFPELE
jgi:hypothetical protein